MRRRPSCPIAFASAILALATLPPGVQAQAIWRSVGPDGRVVYSDHPPAAASNASLLNRRVSAHPIIHEADRPQLPPDPVPAAGGRPELGGLPVDPPAPVGGPSIATSEGRHAALVNALVGVLSYETLTRRVQDVCMQARPDAYDLYVGATNGWRARNAEFVAQARRVLAIGITPVGRRTIPERVEAYTTKFMAPVAAEPLPGRVRFCDQAVRDLNAGRLELRGRPAWLDPLMNFQMP